ncbi:MAG: hypothetical protein LBI69_02200 [Puniceicoccales bacterium]|jgi:hypothetical protein|nr:hypothetical protein [Puniceicoccales bacterium]
MVLPTPLANLPRVKGIQLIVRHRENMKANIQAEKKLLKKRSLVGTVIAKFKNFFGKIIALSFV